MVKQFFKILLLSSALISISCSKNDDKSQESETKTLQWQINDKTFTAQGGKAFVNGDNIYINITGYKADCTTDFFSFENHINVYIPKNINSFPYINDKANVIFHDKKESFNALNSKVIVHNITATEITISIKAETIAGHKAEGKYTVPYCK